jgi:hypothetical protein
LEAKRDVDAYLAERNAAFNAFKKEVSPLLDSHSWVSTNEEPMK